MGKLDSRYTAIEQILSADFHTDDMQVRNLYLRTEKLENRTNKVIEVLDECSIQTKENTFTVHELLQRMSAVDDASQHTKELDERLQAMEHSTKSNGLVLQERGMTGAVFDDIYRAIQECKMEEIAVVEVLRERFSDMCIEWRNTENALEGLMQELREGGVLRSPSDALPDNAGGRPNSRSGSRTSNRPDSARSGRRPCSGSKSHAKKPSTTEEAWQRDFSKISLVSSEGGEDDPGMNKRGGGNTSQFTDFPTTIGGVEFCAQDHTLLPPRPGSPHFKTALRPASGRYPVALDINTSPTLASISTASVSPSRTGSLSTSCNMSSRPNSNYSNSPVRLTKEERYVQSRRARVALRAEIGHVRFTNSLAVG